MMPPVVNVPVYLSSEDRYADPDRTGGRVGLERLLTPTIRLISMHKSSSIQGRPRINSLDDAEDVQVEASPVPTSGTQVVP